MIVLKPMTKYLLPLFIAGIFSACAPFRPIAAPITAIEIAPNQESNPRYDEDQKQKVIQPKNAHYAKQELDDAKKTAQFAYESSTKWLTGDPLELIAKQAAKDKMTLPIAVADARLLWAKADLERAADGKSLAAMERALDSARAALDANLIAAATMMAYSRVCLEDCPEWKAKAEARAAKATAFAVAVNKLETAVKNMRGQKSVANSVRVPKTRRATPSELEQAQKMSAELTARGIGITPAQALALIWTEKDLCGTSKNCE